MLQLFLLVISSISYDSVGFNCPNKQPDKCPKLTNTPVKISTTPVDYCQCNYENIDFEFDTGVTSVASNLFRGANIKSIKISAGIQTIGTGAFQDCTIGSITFSDANFETIEDGAFYNAHLPASLSLTFPSELSSIGDSAFYLVNVNNFDFSKSNSLQFDDEAFSASNIAQLALPSSFSAIGEKKNPFSSCTIANLNLLSASKTSFPTEVLSNAIISKIQFPSDLETIWSKSFSYSTITNLDLSTYPKITKIDSNAFEGASITKIVFNKVKTIESSAFKRCTFLDEMSLSSAADLETIGKNAFQGSKLPTTQVFPGKLKSIDQEAFTGTELKSITFSANDNELSIGQQAFENLITLTEAKIHAKVINSKAFFNCVNMVASEISIESKGNIQNEAFKDCYSLNGPLTIAAATSDYSSINNNAFENSGITSLTLPQLDTIGASAFKNCTKLGKSGDLHAKTISASAFEDDVNLQFDTIHAKTISGKAFYKCKSLNSEITLDMEGTLASYAFANCDLLKTITFLTKDNLDIPTYDSEEIDDLAFEIGDHAFYQSGLKGPLTIPYVLKKIGDSAFAYCPNLNSVTIEGVHYLHKYIDTKAFYRSGINTAVSIPNSVVYIGSEAFAFCNIPALTIYGSNHIVDKEEEICDDNDPPNCEIKTEVDWKGTKVQKDAFYGCKQLNKLTLDGHLVIFDSSSFSECKIQTLTLNAGLEKIPEKAFYGMTSISGAVAIPDSVTEIGSNAFAGCSEITSVTFTPNSLLEDLKSYAFYGCTKLRTTSIPEGVTTINQYTYYGCAALTSINFPTRLTSINQYAFYGCEELSGSLANWNDLNELETISTRAFRGCKNLKGSLNFPQATKTISQEAFYGCSSLSGDLTFGGKIATIGPDAFHGCTGFTGNLLFPEYLEPGVTVQVGKNAFLGCSGFTGQLRLPHDITFTGDDAFRGCSGFTGDLIIREKTTFKEIDGKPVKGTFRDCSGFDGNLTIKIIDFKSIPDFTFWGCSKLKGELSLGDVSSIGEGAFYGCSSLTGSLDINIAVISDYAFYNCKGLDGNLIFEKDVTKVGKYTFYGCSGLKGTLDCSSVTEIGKYAFAGCSGLSGPLDFEKLKEVGEYAFSDCSGFSDYLKFEITSDNLHIHRYAFKGCSGFKKGTLSFVMDSNEEIYPTDNQIRLNPHYNYDYFLKIENNAFDKTKFKDIYYLGRFEPDCDYDIGISSTKGIHTSSNYANKTFCHNPIHKSKLSGGAIAGIVIAVIVVVAIIVALIVYFILKQKKNRDNSEAEVEMNANP